MVQLLVEKGVDIEARDKYGWTALHEAASSGHETTVRLLVEEGALLEHGSPKQ
jgi:ankyrin repeat protein